MKKLFFLLSMSFVKMVFANDLTAVVTNATVGFSNGEIDLSVNAGVTPYTFAWTGPDGFTSTNEDITDLAAGEYCVAVNDLYCGVATLCVVVEEDIASGIEAQNLSSVSIFPNPFSKEFTIVFDSPSTGEYTFKLYDASGKSVWTENRKVTKGKNSGHFTLQKDLAEGRYEIAILDNHATILSRSIVRIR